MADDNPVKFEITLRQKITYVICGVIFFIISLEILLRLNGFLFVYLQEHGNRVSIDKKGIYRILCLGESTTAMGGKDSYPRQLEKILNGRSRGRKFSVINKGSIGVNSSFILTHLEDNLNEYNPDMVIVMTGTNDRYIKYYEGIKDTNSLLFKELRVYRLIKIIWVQFRNRIHKSKETYDNQINNVCADDSIFKKQIIEIDRNNKDKYYVEIDRDDLNADSLDNKAYVSFGGPAYYPQSEWRLKEGLKLYPRNEKIYLELGHLYISKGEYNQAANLFKKVISINPANDKAYVGLGSLYKMEGNYVQAEALFEKAIRLNHSNDVAYTSLGWICRDNDDYNSAKELFKKAIKLNPRNDSAYVGLGWCYRYGDDPLLSEQSFKKAIELNPKNQRAYVELGWVYLSRGEYLRAEELFKKALEFNPRSERICRSLILLYKKMGKYELVQEYTKKVTSLGLNYSPVTQHNYLEMKNILSIRGIKLVCVQFPMRSIEPLKKIFEYQKGITFVDNEKLFKDAVNKEIYDEYFIDMFAGDFGHCTSKGNRLLAEHIADVILEECFTHRP
jgi:tetratricopeptide (TPR) repeat protein